MALKNLFENPIVVRTSRLEKVTEFNDCKLTEYIEYERAGMKKIVIGLTGNIACGKSVVTKEFSRLGASVIDADVISRELMSPGVETYYKVIKAFGEEILLPNYTIDRKRLGDIIFEYNEEKLKLEEILHPAIDFEICTKLQHAIAKIVVVDAALIFETDTQYRYDKIIIVGCDPDTQLRRLIIRDGLSVDEAKARIASQVPSQVNIPHADFVIDNRGLIGECLTATQDIYYKLVRGMIEK